MDALFFSITTLAARKPALKKADSLRHFLLKKVAKKG
jgi:hypothetical protein